MRLLRIALIAVCGCGTLVACGGGSSGGNMMAPVTPASAAATQSPATPVSTVYTPGATVVAGVEPTAPPHSYFVGGMQGQTCLPKDQQAVANGTATWLPTEDLCVRSAPGAGVGTIAFSADVVNRVAIAPAIDGSGDTLEYRVQSARRARPRT